VASTLPVDLNRGEYYSVDPGARSVEATGSFEVELRNHGNPVHVHLKLDESLAAAASIAEPNHYVDTQSTTAVPVDVAEVESPVEGTLKVLTSHGNVSTDVRVRVAPPDDDVAVDDDVAQPGGDGREESGGERTLPALPERAVGARSLAVAVLIAIALLLAAGAVAVGRSPAVVSGVLAVLFGVGSAGYLLRE